MTRLEETAADGDWLKIDWDLVDDDGRVDSLPRLRAWLARLGMTPAQFRRLPIYRYNVDRLPWLRGLES